jgi:hypothetical protein
MAILIRDRLRNQHLVGPRLRSAADLVRAFGAVQGQDYLGSLWAIGQRLASATERDVEQAIEDGRIVRTWPMRGTLHWVAAEDVRWMLRLLAPRVIARSARRYQQLELTAADLARSRRLLSKALEDRSPLTRREAYDVLARGGVSPAGQRGIHVLAHLAQESLLCFGPRRGKQPTFVLLDAWVPKGRTLEGEDAVVELARRYAASHGPATVHDFAWWSGLPMDQARAGWAAVAVPRPSRAKTPPQAALLPPWDEYVVAYRDRDDTMGHLPAQAREVRYASGLSLVVVDGLVSGTWRRTLRPRAVEIAWTSWTELTTAQRRRVEQAADRYRTFLGYGTL